MLLGKGLYNASWELARFKIRVSLKRTSFTFGLFIIRPKIQLTFYTLYNPEGWNFSTLILWFVVFLPGNSGYIHPDEYFQSLEVTMGDILGKLLIYLVKYKLSIFIRSLV